MTVENKIIVHILNGEDKGIGGKFDGPEWTLTVRSVPLYGMRVELEINQQRAIVSAAELRAAIANATNTGE